MSALEAQLFSRLADFSLTRRVLHSLLAARSRRHLTRLDRLQADRAQLRLLRGLIHAARHTPFGRDHDFGRIRSLADFRRLVPLRTPQEFARVFTQGTPQSGLPAGDRSPGRLPLASAILETTLALMQRASPQESWFRGHWLCLEEELTSAQLPLLVRPLLRTARLSSVCPAESVRVLLGATDLVSRLFDRQRCLRAKEQPTTLWPYLSAILLFSEDGNTGPTRAALRQGVGSHVLILDVLRRPEATFALEDPQLGGLRLLFDHGCFFEFVPFDRTFQRHPPRLSLEDVVVGFPYEIVLSSARCWALKSGLIVRFERLQPPILRVLPDLRPLFPRRLSHDEKAAMLARAPHRSGSDSLAALPETFVRTPSSRHADRAG